MTNEELGLEIAELMAFLVWHLKCNCDFCHSYQQEDMVHHGGHPGYCPESAYQEVKK